jgi:hypothetical protein
LLCTVYTEQNYQKFKNANSNIQIHLKTSSVLLKKAKKQNVASKKQNLKNWRSKKASFCFFEASEKQKSKEQKSKKQLCCLLIIPSMANCHPCLYSR